MIKYYEYPDRETWLANRNKSIGASEIAVACNISHFISQSDLWEIKLGRRESNDLSQNKRVQYGTEAEKHLRGLFRLKHIDEYKVEYYPYRVYYNTETPFLTATLDGLITDLKTKKIGGYECKTVLVDSKKVFDEWDNKIPNAYYCQVCQQMYSAGLDFVIVNAELRQPDYTSEIREYLITREQAKDDIEFVVDKGKEFWSYVITKKRPPLTLTL